MTLQQVNDIIQKKIQALSPGQPLTLGYSDIADTNFYYLLLLLKQGDTLTIYSPALSWNTGQTELDLKGELLIYNSSCADFELAFTIYETGQLLCVITCTLPSLSISDLISLQLIGPGSDSISYLPEIGFSDVKMAASSGTLAMSIAAIKHNTGWSILGLSLFPLTDIGYVFTATISIGSEDPLPQLQVIGKFQLGQTIIDLAVMIPVSSLDTPGQWGVSFSLPKPLNNTFQDLSNLLFFNNLNNLIPSQILSMPPGKQTDEKGIFLDKLAILFTLSNRSIQYLEIDVSARGDWELGPVQLTYSSLQLGFVPGNTSSGMQLSIFFTLTMVFGSTATLLLTLSIPSIKDNWTVSLSEDSPNEMNSMDDIKNIPGSASKDDFHFPTALNTASTGLTLKDFTAIFNPFAKTWQEVSIEITYEAEWDVLPGFFTIEKLDLSVKVANNATPGNGVDITGYFSTDLLLGGDNGFYVNLYAEKRVNSWFFSATAQNIQLTQIIQQLLGNSFTLPSYVPVIVVDLLQVTIDTEKNLYTGTGKISMSWPITIAGTEYHLDTGIQTQISADRSVTPVKYTGFVQGTINIPDAPGFGNSGLTLTYNFGENDVYLASFMGVTASFNATCGLIKLNLGDHSLGDLISQIILWAEPNSSATLEAPWDILNDISLQDLNFFFNIKDKSFGFSYKPGNGINLGIVTINAIGISYVKPEPKNPASKYQVQLQLDGQLFGQPIPAWDLLNPDTAPEVPGHGDNNFELDYLALGQHVSLRSTASINNLEQALALYQTAFEEPSEPGKIPINAQSPVIFNANANWMIGARFIIMNTADIGVIFNDPELYGLLIKLSGEKAKIFAGLEFQIIYKKISDTIGVYEIELKLPDVMRHLEFGEVSITLPVIGLQIYTNGNFKVDVGFPWNNDFSRSFTVQAFPFIGSGGFYFAWLSSETATSVPRITNGNFNPVIEFGIGLSLGLGKTVDEGILSGGLSVTVVGILQGIIGFYNPNPVPGNQKPVSGANYYAIQGTMAIVGRVYGSIDFAIVKASLDITVYVMARITFISYEPIAIYLEAGVSVTLTISIDLGLFSIHIHLSFSATLKENFTIGQATTPPWTLAQQQDKYLLTRHHPLFLFANAGTPLHKIELVWIPLQYKTEILAPALNIYYVPSLTVALDEKATTPTQLAQYMTMLFIDASNPAQVETSASSFTKLVKNLVTWTVNANKTDKTWTSDQYSEVWVQKVDINYLQNIYTYFTCQKEVSIPVTDINDFLKAGFDLSLIYQDQDNAGDNLYGSVFPMFPLLKQSTQFNQQPYGTAVDFATFNSVNQQYQEDITAYFEKITVNFMNPLEAQEDSCGMYSGVPPAPITSNSMAGFIYQDYFLMLAKAGIGEAIKLMKAFPYQYQGEQLSVLADQFGVVSAAIALSNKSVLLTKGLLLTVTGDTYSLSGSELLTTLAAEFSVTITDIITLNRTTPGLILESVTVSCNDGSKKYTTVTGDSFQDIANHLTLNPIVDAVNGSIPDLVALTDISTLAGLFAPNGLLLVDAPRYKITKGDTLQSIVTQYNPHALTGSCSIYSFCAINATVSGLLQSGVKTPLGPQNNYVLVPTDTLLILADRFTSGNLKTLADQIKDLDIWQPLAAIFLPSFIYTVDDGQRSKDSFESLSNQFSLTIETLVANNPTMGNIWPNNTSLTITNIGPLSIQTIIDTMESSGAIDNLSGMTARFLLHGLRLPSPQEIHEVMLQGKQNGWENTLDTFPIYELTGQRVVLPTLISTDTFSFSLEKEAAVGEWIHFKTITTPGSKLPTAANSLKVTLSPGDIGRVSTILSETLNPAVKVLRPQPAYMESARHYNFSNPVAWQYNSSIPLWTGMPPATVPSIWPIPDTLLQAAFSHKTLLPLVTMVVGTHDNPNAALVTTPVTRLRWGLEVSLTVSQVTKDITGTGSSLLPNVYQLNSTNEAGLVYLERLIQFNNLQTKDILDTVHILFQPNTTGNSNSGLQSNGPDSTTAFIIKTNFSTDSHPVSFAADITNLADTPVLSSTPKDFIEKVWEASIVQTGGFYLYYSAGAANEGLPDSLFTNNKLGNLQLLIVFNDNLPADTIYDFMNAAAIGENINSGNSLLFASAQNQPVNYPFSPTDTLAGIASKYNIWVDDLGRALAGYTLNNNLLFSISATIYEVRPGDSLSRLVAYFGIGQTGFQQKLIAANPGLTEADYSVVWTLVNIPALVFTTGLTNPSLTMLDQISVYYFIDMAALANQIQKVPGLFTGQVSFIDKPVNRVAVIAPGNVSIELQRVNEETGAVVSDQLDALFNLLGVSVAANTDFVESGEGLPAGNQDLDTKIPGSALLAGADTDSTWQYLKAIPVAPYAKSNTMITKNVIMDLWNSNPYAGLGGTVQINMEWLDLFGNRTKTPFSFPDLYPATTPGPLNHLPISIRYTDQLIAIEKWPNLSLNFLYQPIDNQASLELIFNFDVSKYAVYQPVDSSLPVNPQDPDSPTRGKQFAADLRSATSNAKTDLQTYQSIYYQLWQQDITITVTDSVSKQEWVLQEAQMELLRSLLNDIYTYLSELIKVNLTYTYYEVVAADIKDYPYDTAVFIAGKLGVTNVNSFISINTGQQHPFSINTDMNTDYKIIVPSLAMPAIQTLSQPAADNNTDAIFELQCQFSIQRNSQLVDDNFIDAQGVASVQTTVKPIASSLANSLGQFDTTFDQRGSNQLALTDFANYFEKAYHLQYPDSKYKVATGTPLTEVVTNGQSKQYWMIRFNNRGIQFGITGQPLYFSPAPLANSLLSFTGDKAIPIQPFSASSGLGIAVKKNFSGENLDTWAALCLEAIDQLLLPQYAIPAYIIDQNATAGTPAYLTEIVAAKEKLAKAIVSNNPADQPNSRFLNILQNPLIDSGSLSEAQEALRQSLLIKLSNAYTIDAVIQFKATIVSPYPDTMQPIAPNLYGQPLANVIKESEMVSQQQAFSLSTAKIPLTNGNSHFTFIFTTKNKQDQKNFVLDLSYQVNHIEYDITPVTVTGFAGEDKEDYNASTWLSFITPMDPVSIEVTPTSSIITVPVPERTYPTPPSLVSQTAIPQAVTDPSESDRLQELLEWQYQYVYSQVETAQDSINTELQFNITQPAKSDGLAVIPDEELLFANLAQFAEVYPQLQQIFSSQLITITPSSKPADMNSARIALDAFATIVKNISDSWQNWQQPKQTQYINTNAGSTYRYHLEDKKLTYTDKPDPTPEEVLEIILSLTQQGSDFSLDDFPLPVVTIDGFLTETPITKQGKELTSPSEASYIFRDNTTGKLLLYKDRLNYKQRILTYPFTNILSNQNAWGAVAELRNFDLVDGNATTDNFIYKTPEVRFANYLVPYMDTINYPNLKPINIFLLTNQDPSSKMPLEVILQNLFMVLFNVVPTGNEKIKMGVTYQYNLTAGSPDTAVLLPFYITPPLDFAIPADYQTVAGCADTPAGMSFVCKLAYYIRKWFTDKNPSIHDAQYLFDLSIYSSLENSQMPLVRIRNLYLLYAHIENPILPTE